MDAIKEANKVVSRYAAQREMIIYWVKEVVAFLLLEIVVMLVVIGAITLVRM